MSQKIYSDEFLISELIRFYNENGRSPTVRDFQNNNYPYYRTYYKHFGSWPNALEIAGLVVKKRYTNEFLISELQRFYKTNNKIPTEKDFHYNRDYPSDTTYRIYFGSWNNALNLADLPIHKHICLTNRPNVCEVCGTTETKQWNDRDGVKLCFNCYIKPRNFIYGILNSESRTGMGVIAEYIVAEVLGDCIKCNTQNNFCAPCDFISGKYGTINVKSSKLNSENHWIFRKSENSQIPDYYICLSFNNDKSEIEYVFAIPGNSDLVTKSGITITNSVKGLERTIPYKLDASVYNKVYKNLDIYLLPEFRNLNRQNLEEVTC